MKSLLSLLVLALVVVVPARAETIVVSNLNASGTGSLRAAISSARDGDTIQFSKNGTIALLRHPLVIDKNLTIVGPGPDKLTLSGKGERRVLEVKAGSDVLITNVTFANGVAETGGGIYNQGTLRLRNVVVTQNASKADGGGIYNDRGTLTLTNSTVSLNEARRSNASGGGVVNFEGVLNILDNSVISDNLAHREGGGVYNLRGDVVVDNSTISNNTTGQDGGGIFTIGGLSVKDSFLLDNTSEGGGAVANLGLTPVSLSGTRVAGNTVAGLGGALLNNANGPVSVDNVTFAGNVSTQGNGGAVANIVGKMTINDSTFTDNSARHEGGTLFNQSVLTLTNVIVMGSTAEQGGAVRNLGQLTLVNSTLSNNAASLNGGAMSSAGFATTTIDNGIFSNNSSEGNGGSLSNLGEATMRITSSTVTTSSALNGGGIWNVGTLSVRNGEISNNRARRGGGGIFNQGRLELESSSVLANTAQVDGGGIWNDGSLTFSDSQLENNETVDGLFGGGAGIWNALGGELTLTQTNCAENVVKGNMVDVFNNGGKLNNATACVVRV